VRPRIDIHRLFDRGHVAIDEGIRFVVGQRLRDDFENGQSYYGMRGRQISLPDDPYLQPSREALAWHREQVYLG